jgi:hypothetical protein
MTVTVCIVVSERRRRLRGDRSYAFPTLEPYLPAAFRSSYATEPSKAVQVVSSSGFQPLLALAVKRAAAWTSEIPDSWLLRSQQFLTRGHGTTLDPDRVAFS